MKEEFLVVKVKSDQDGIIQYLRESLEHKTRQYYNVGSGDKETIEELDKNDSYKTIFILFSEQEQAKYEAIEIFIGMGQINQTQRNGALKENLSYKIDGHTQSELVIGNFISIIGLDLKNDFVINSYISIEYSQELLKQIEFAVQDSYSCSAKPYGQQTYTSYDCDESLSEFSQKNEYCKRTIAVMDSADYRSEFQRDRERIVHAKAFRRLVDKAQIFTSLKGDHYRTRMTHTLEVSQIATQIARSVAIKLDGNYWGQA